MIERYSDSVFYSNASTTCYGFCLEGPFVFHPYDKDFLHVVILAPRAMVLFASLVKLNASAIIVSIWMKLNHCIKSADLT